MHCPEVKPQAVLSGESLVTKFTYKFFLPRMRNHMLLQVLPQTEGLITEMALMVSFTCVNYEMSVSRSFRFILPITDRAREYCGFPVTMDTGRI